MIECGEGFGFALESDKTVGVVCKRIGQDFDRDLAAEIRVPRAPHLPHPADADLGGDFVDSEAGTGSKGQDAADYTGRKRARMGSLLLNAAVSINLTRAGVG